MPIRRKLLALASLAAIVAAPIAMAAAEDAFYRVPLADLKLKDEEPDYSGMTRLPFTIRATAALKEGEAFYRAKQQHYQQLLDRDCQERPGFGIRCARHAANLTAARTKARMSTTVHGVEPRTR